MAMTGLLSGLGAAVHADHAFNCGDLLASLTEAAKAAAALQDTEEEVAGPARLVVEAEARLATVLEVNRTLHAALSEKKRALQQSKGDTAYLQPRLEALIVAESVRAARSEELQSKLDAPKAAGAVGLSRDEKLLQRETVKLEAKIASLNDENVSFSERHKDDRTRLLEQQGRLRSLGKRERELARSLDFLATKLNEAASAASGPSNASAALSPRVGVTGDLAEQPADGAIIPVDFRNLPGLCLSKLVGRHPHRAPPQANPNAVATPTLVAGSAITAEPRPLQPPDGG